MNAVETFLAEYDEAKAKGETLEVILDAPSFNEFGPGTVVVDDEFFGAFTLSGDEEPDGFIWATSEWNGRTYGLEY